MVVELSEPTPDAIACTLTETEHIQVRAAWQRLFATSLKSRDLLPAGVLLTFAPGAEPELRRLIDIERQCCAWITFAVDGPKVVMTAVGDGVAALQNIWSI